MTCFTEVNNQNRSSNIKFAVANIEHHILGTPFFKKNIQNIDFQQNIMTYKIKNNMQNFLQNHKLQHLQKKIIHRSHTFILLNVKNQFTSNQDQERLYTSQLKTILTCTLNWKTILNFIHQFHIHTSYKNLKIFPTS